MFASEFFFFVVANNTTQKLLFLPHRCLTHPSQRLDLPAACYGLQRDLLLDIVGRFAQSCRAEVGTINLPQLGGSRDSAGPRPSAARLAAHSTPAPMDLR